MPKLKVLSGEDVINVLLSFGFNMASQKGSHVKLKRDLPNGIKQTMTIPKHAGLDRGTLHAIYRQALRYIPEEKLMPYFYTN